LRELRPYQGGVNVVHPSGCSPEADIWVMISEISKFHGSVERELLVVDAKSSLSA
jgi:hypothetical protein